MQGAIYQMLNHGICTGGLFLIVGMLSDRRHTRQIAEFGGLKHVMPRLVAAFLIITLSSIGMPGPQWVHRRVPHDARRLPLAAGACRRRRHRRDPLGGLHALDVPAGQLRAVEQPEEQDPARPRAAGMGSPRAHRGDGHRHGRGPELLPGADGARRSIGWSSACTRNAPPSRRRRRNNRLLPTLRRASPLHASDGCGTPRRRRPSRPPGLCRSPLPSPCQRPCP